MWGVVMNHDLLGRFKVMWGFEPITTRPKERNLKAMKIKSRWGCGFESHSSYLLFFSFKLHFSSQYHGLNPLHHISFYFFIFMVFNMVRSRVQSSMTSLVWIHFFNILNTLCWPKFITRSWKFSFNFLASFHQVTP